MDTLIITALRLINGVFTLAFFPNLYLIYRKTNRRFYLLWGIGFLFYGINVIIRTSMLAFNIESMNMEVFSFMFMVIGFTLIITGIGDLINRTRLLLLASLSVPLALAVLFFTTRPMLLGQVIAFLPYVFIAVSLLIIRIYFSATIDFLVIGWMMIALTNIGYGFGFISPFYVEIYIILAKAILYYGSLYPRFSYLVDDLRRFLISGVPTQYFDNPGEKFVIINSTSGKRSNEIQWIKNRMNENSKKAIKTIMLTTYDLISPNDLKATDVDEENLYVVRMVQGGKSAFDIFTERLITINDDLNDLDILFTDILAFSSERRINCQIILYNLSSLIHTHGWKRVYTFLLSKISYLKNSNVYLYAFYYPKTHEVESDIAKFEQLADNVVDI
ncbi:MAG: hypothetical protein ABIJ47_15590 [Candidatus Bathyarchaeota archaeon]